MGGLPLFRCLFRSQKHFLCSSQLLAWVWLSARLSIAVFAAVPLPRCRKASCGYHALMDTCIVPRVCAVPLSIPLSKRFHSSLRLLARVLLLERVPVSIFATVLLAGRRKSWKASCAVMDTFIFMECGLFHSLFPSQSAFPARRSLLLGSCS